MKKWFKSKFNEFGEKAVDSMVNLIFSKNDTPINYFNQTPLINAITKSVNSKVTVKQPNTKLLNTDLDRYPPICELDLLVSEGIFLLISDGNMAHTKYFSNVNRSVSANSSSTSSNLSNSNFSGLNESEQEKYSMGSIRHSMIVDEKKSKIEFDSVGPVKPYFCRYKIEVEMNNKHYSSDKKSMQEDFNRVIFDYSFTGKVYNINTDVLISLWCDLDMNKYSMSQNEDVLQKKQFQPRKISSVQCPSIYAPRNSANSHRSGVSSVQDSNSTYGESPTSQFTNSQSGFDDSQSQQYDNMHTNNNNSKHNNTNTSTSNKDNNMENNLNEESDNESDSDTDSESEGDKSDNNKDNKESKDGKYKKDKKDKKKKDKKEKKKKKKDLNEFDIEEFLLSNEEEDNNKEHKDKKDKHHKDDKNVYSRKLGRAMLSVPLLLSSFKPEGSLDLHEDLKYLLKYSRRVLSVNMENFLSSKQSNDHTSKDAKLDTNNSDNNNDNNKDNNNNNTNIKEDTYYNNKEHKDKDFYKLNSGKTRKGSRYTIRSCFWLQLLPFNENDDFKFVRPYCGYPCFGMRNPVDSIGFLLVTVQLGFDVNPSLLPILNNMVPHGYCWTVAKNFELFHVSAVADRFVVFFTNMPIWVTRLLLGGTQLVFNNNYIDDYIKRKFANYLKKNKFSNKNVSKTQQTAIENKNNSKLYNLETCELDGIDLLFILPFWFLLYELIVLCSLWKMPLVLYLMLLLILFYYQVVMNRFTDFGDKISMLKNLQPHGLLGDYVGVGRTKYKSCTLFSNDNSLLYSLENLSSCRTLSSRSESSVPESFVASLNSSRQNTPSNSNVSSRSNTSPMSYVTYPQRTHNKDSSNYGLNDYKTINPNLNLHNLNMHNLDGNRTPRSMASQLMSETNLDNDNKDSNSNNNDKNTVNDSKESKDNNNNTNTSNNKHKEKEKTHKNTTTDKERKEDKFNNSLFENHLYKKFKLINRFGVVANDSLVTTPFGNYRLNFLGLGEEYPIFSDDLGDFDLKEFVKAVLISLKYIQQILGYICTTVEKVRFSLDTGYYPTTVLTLFLLFMTLVPLSLFLKLLSRFSLRTARFVLFLYILFSCMKPHLKVMVRDLLYYSSRYVKLPFLSRKKGGTGLLTKLFYLLKSTLYLVKEFYKNWLLGLPDHREVDHRKICVLQTVPSLCHLLPKDYEIDWRYFKKQFKNHYKAFENTSKLSEVDMKVYAKCKSMIERTVLDEYLSSNIPNDLSGD